MIDIDGEEGERWLSGRDLPDTLTAKSSRGRHLYYAGTATGVIGAGPSVDILGSGRYVVAPPSLHASGEQYVWENDILTTPLANLPEWVHEVIAKPRALGTKRPQRDRRGWLRAAVGDAIYQEGNRNDMLYKRASRMRRGAGLDQDEIVAALKVTNRRRCRPPLEEPEVDTIAKSAADNPVQLPDYKAMRDLALIPSRLAVLVTLCAEANAMGECTVSYGVLADKAGVSISTAQRAVHVLKKRKIITTTYRRFLSLRYTICDLSEQLATSAESEASGARTSTEETPRQDGLAK